MAIDRSGRIPGQASRGRWLPKALTVVGAVLGAALIFIFVLASLEGDASPDAAADELGVERSAPA